MKWLGYTATNVDLSYAVCRDCSGPFSTIVVDGQLHRIRLDDNIASHFEYQFRDNGQAVEETLGFVREARRCRTLFDVGALHGVFSILFCQTGSDKQAFAFEPSPTQSENCRTLVTKNGLGAQVTILPYLVGAYVGTVTGNLRENGFIQLGQDSAAQAAIECEQRTLDSECDRIGVWPDLLKIDVEGAEWEVLCGARKLLREHAPTVCLELHNEILDQRGIAPRQVIDLLWQTGYSLFSPVGASISPRKVASGPHAIFRLIARHAGA